MHMDQAGWTKAYQKKDALWFHDGNPRRPHILLTMGGHSNGFFNSRPVIEDEAILQMAAEDSFEIMVQTGVNLKKIDGVVGPQKGATKFAELLSKCVSHYTGRPCFSVSPRKEGEGENRVMIFSPEEARLVRGRTLWLCEDVTTTLTSVMLTKKAVADAGGNTFTKVSALVNRSGHSVIDGQTIFPLIYHPMTNWPAGECELCALGSEAIRAKDNWARLVAEY